jgi:hypothetical protein
MGDKTADRVFVLRLWRELVEAAPPSYVWRTQIYDEATRTRHHAMGLDAAFEEIRLLLRDHPQRGGAAP